MRSRRFFALAVFASALAGPVVAQQDGPPPPVEKPEFGTTGTSSVRLTAYDFSGFESVPYATGSGGSIGRYPTSPMSFAAGVHVPGGTNITRIELDYCDNNASGRPHAHEPLAVRQPGPELRRSFERAHVQQQWLRFRRAVWPRRPRRQLPRHVQARRRLLGPSTARTFWRGPSLDQLQVSPAPGAASFNDVPTSDPAFQYIEALFASGITAGCSGGNYCPDAPLTRRQMAVFLSKALGLYWNLQ